MLTAGLYETSGDWLYNIGLPGKSGIGGGIVAVSPGKGGLGTFAPPLDRRATASRGSWWPSSYRNGWGWTCSSRSLRRNARPVSKDGRSPAWIHRPPLGDGTRDVFARGLWIHHAGRQARPQLPVETFLGSGCSRYDVVVGRRLAPSTDQRISARRLPPVAKPRRYRIPA